MKTKKGFTLIELMIVVAIIGILAAIAIPKFADLIKKSKEGATKGSLGALRSALTIYYGEQEGVYPDPGAALLDNPITTFNDTGGPFLTKYLDNMPTVKLGQPAAYTDTAVTVYLATPNENTTATGGKGAWLYICNTSADPDEPQGEFKVNAENTDTKGNVIATW